MAHPLSLPLLPANSPLDQKQLHVSGDDWAKLSLIAFASNIGSQCATSARMSQTLLQRLVYAKPHLRAQAISGQSENKYNLQEECDLRTKLQKISDLAHHEFSESSPLNKRIASLRHATPTIPFILGDGTELVKHGAVQKSWIRFHINPRKCSKGEIGYSSKILFSFSHGSTFPDAPKLKCFMEDLQRTGCTYHIRVRNDDIGSLLSELDNMVIHFENSIIAAVQLMKVASRYFSSQHCQLLSGCDLLVSNAQDGTATRYSYSELLAFGAMQSIGEASSEASERFFADLSTDFSSTIEEIGKLIGRYWDA